MSNIPIFILNHNRLSTLERLVDQLLLLGYSNIIILDMGSTYPPLLEYYQNNLDIKVILAKNKGQQYLWASGILGEQNHSWVAVTDSDIELSENTPKGFIENMINTAKDFRTDKCGLALEIKDLPDNFLSRIIKPIERKYWLERLHHTLEVYDAAVDTTFCVVRSDKLFQYYAIRIAGEYTCKHIPWYIDWDNLNEEESYFLQQADTQFSTYKQHYLNYLKQKI